MVNIADVGHLHCQATNPPKNKFVICVCPQNHYYFFVNSQPRRRKPTTQVLIKRHELACLSHDSHVDTSKFVTFGCNELKTIKILEPLSNALKLRIKKAVRDHGILPTKHKSIIEANF